ncbi:hypothetical protein DET54_104356 [Paenibacillus pabuli]|uniref:Uncharacterized protein n=1 Tax=Paenibacillus pabuli TaxID=1472 RepID=A0ABX9BMQ3_9BACL|nr:hypothetical protein DET54_104356 [Paenibacillus pabuli]
MLRSVFAFTIDNEVVDRLDYEIYVAGAGEDRVIPRSPMKISYPEKEKVFTTAILRLTLWCISAKKDAYAFSDNTFSLFLL